jgi:hypothetical protein
MSSPPAAQLSEKPGNGPQRMRFSLQTLLGAMTIAAVLCAVLFSPTWHADERLLMSFWFAGLILGASSGRALGKPGIYSGALGAVLGTLLVCKYTSTARLGINASRDWDTSLFVPYLMFVIVGGWTLAVAVLTLYHLAVKGSLERWLKQPSWSRTAVPVILIIGLAAYAIGQWRDDTWRPVAELNCPSQFGGALPHVELSHGGDVIVAHPRQLRGSYASELPLRLFRKHNRHYIQTVIHPPDSQLVAESRLRPDGQQVALLSYSNAPIRLFDLDTEQVVGELPSTEALHQVEFNVDGSQLLLTTDTSRIQRLRVFDTTSPRETKVQLFPFAGKLYVSPSGQLLARTIRVAVEAREAGIELGETDLEVLTPAGEPLGRIRNVRDLWEPLFASDHQRVAMDDRIWNRQGGKIDSMPGRVVGLLGSRQALVLRRDVLPAWRDYMPAWLAEMPFLRHALSAKQHGELLLIDQAEGTVIARSTREPEMMGGKVSRDGTTAIGSCWDGRILVWKIPQ